MNDWIQNIILQVFKRLPTIGEEIEHNDYMKNVLKVIWEIVKIISIIPKVVETFKTNKKQFDNESKIK